MKSRVIKCLPVYLTLTLASQSGPGTEKTCEHVYRLQKGEKILLELHNFTQSGRGQSDYCTLQVNTAKRLRIVLDLVYKPLPATGQPGMDCSSDYVHVGNDKQRVDVDSLTSYRFCGTNVHHELVSRGNHMWLVYKATQTPQALYVQIHAQKPVSCIDMFPCSPVQCVDRSRICDGVIDCYNHQDEFCHKRCILYFPASSSLPKTLTEPCFRCGDGTCIQPRLSPYHINYGRILWYLCDGFSHCPDAWDERKDICLKMNGNRVGSIIECVPHDLQFGPNGTVTMWNDINCDDNWQCYKGTDVNNCYKEKSTSTENKLRADPGTIGIVVGVFVISCVVVLAVYKIRSATQNAARPSTNSTMCTQGSLLLDDNPVITSGAQKHSRDCPTTNTLIDVSKTGNDSDFDINGYEQSHCSVILQHTTV